MKKKGIIGGLIVVAVATLLTLLIAKLTSGPSMDYMIVATNFPAYDFARAVVGQENVKMLVPPGAEVHDFEPSIDGIETIKHAKLFVYNGGESESWVEDFIDASSESLRMMDVVEPVSDGRDDDEHIWTSPLNAVEIIDAIFEKSAKLWPDKVSEFQTRSEEYLGELAKIDKVIKDVVAKGSRKELVFGDRFPFRYLTHEYGLSYTAVFSGCADETETSARDIATVVEKVRADNIPVVLKLELSDGKIARTIAGETGAKVMELHSAHNVSKEEFESGITYVDIMKKNVSVLREALGG